MDDKELIQRLLTCKPINYRSDFAKIAGNIQSGVFLSQLFYWADKGSDVWIYKTQAEWYEETGLSRRNQETARHTLVNLGVVSELKKGTPAKLYYRLNFDKLYSTIKEFYEKKGVQTRMAESDNQGCTNRADKDVRTEQTRMYESDNLSLQRLHTENTTESTTDIKGQVSAKQAPLNKSNKVRVKCRLGSGFYQGDNESEISLKKIFNNGYLKLHKTNMPWGSKSPEHILSFSKMIEFCEGIYGRDSGDKVIFDEIHKRSIVLYKKIANDKWWGENVPFTPKSLVSNWEKMTGAISGQAKKEILARDILEGRRGR